MKQFILKETEIDGKLNIEIVKIRNVPQKDLDKSLSLIKASKSFVDKISRIDFGKLNKNFK